MNKKGKSPFSEAVRIAGQRGINTRTNQSLNWYREYVKTNLSNINTWEAVRNTGETGRVFEIRYGGMYTFIYDPKYKNDKNKLPYYDATPLVIPFRDDGDSFLAFNLHYLPLTLRARVLDYLFTLNNMAGTTDNTRNAKRYEYFSQMGKSPLFIPCVKRYLKSQVRSRFLEFKTDHWELSVFLPTANFKGASTTTVHADSAHKIARKGR